MSDHFSADHYTNHFPDVFQAYLPVGNIAVSIPISVGFPSSPLLSGLPKSIFPLSFFCQSKLALHRLEDSLQHYLEIIHKRKNSSNSLPFKSILHKGTL